jgi:ribonuclease Z
MRTILLGTGAPPPNPKRRGPSTLVTLGGSEHFLVDAGSGVGVQLVQAGVRPYDWPPIFITHHHSDHTIDLGHLLITRWIVGQNAPLEVYGPAGTRRQMDLLLEYLRWDIDVRRAHMHDRPRPEVRVTEVEEGRVLERDGLRVSAFLVEHDPVKPAFGYRFDAEGQSLVVSGDTRPCENLMRWARGRAAWSSRT